MGRMGMKGEFNFRGRNPVKIRCCQYLNNVVEQDHRRVKGQLRPMLGLKTFYNGRRFIIGIELAQKIHKRQFAIPIPWQSNPAVIWRHLMAASSASPERTPDLIAPIILSAPEPRSARWMVKTRTSYRYLDGFNRECIQSFKYEAGGCFEIVVCGETAEAKADR